MAAKASLSTSKLARPRTLIHQLANKVQDYLHFPDPEPLYVVLGTVAANMLSGDPAWLMLVGAPGTGRTTLLTTLKLLPRTHIISNVSGPGSFISASSKKDKAKDADGGLLKRTGDRGLWIFKDFSTSVLTMPHESQKTTLGVLREIFDQDWSRDPGTDGGKHISWEGKIGVLGASTGEIDRANLVNQAGSLGERWMYYRYPEKQDYYGECMTALKNRVPDERKLELRQMMLAFFDAIDLTWGCKINCRELAEGKMEIGEDGEQIPHTCKPEKVWRELRHVESTRLTAMASLSTVLRSSLMRDNYSREVIDVPQKEAPMRLVGEFGQLYAGLAVIGLDVEERWAVLGKVAVDSAPRIKGMVFSHVMLAHREGNMAEGSGGNSKLVGLEELCFVTGCSVGTVRRAVEDMQAFGVLRKVSDREVRLGEWAEELVKGCGWEK